MNSFILRSTEVQRVVLEIIRRTPLDGTMELIIRPYKPKRTLGQNSYLWKLHSEVAAWLSINSSAKWRPEEVHEVLFKPTWCGMVDVQIGKVTLQKPRSSADLSTAEMAEAITKYQVWAVSKGIEITWPDEVYQ